MRLITLVFIVTLLTGCAGPQIVVRHFKEDNILHMSRIHEVKGNTAISNYVFYLNQGDTVPLKLKSKSSVIEFAENQIGLKVKKKLYFRIEKAENASQADLDRILTITPEQMADADPKEFRDILKTIDFFISADGSSWALLTDKEAVKKVLGLKGGEFSAGMALSSNEGLWFMLSVKMHELQDT